MNALKDLFDISRTVRLLVGSPEQWTSGPCYGRNDVLFLIVIALKHLVEISRSVRHFVGSPEQDRSNGPLVLVGDDGRNGVLFLRVIALKYLFDE